RPDRQNAGSGDLAEQLRASVEIDRVRRVLLDVLAAPAGEDAVGAEMDETRARVSAELREEMREERIDRDAEHRIGRVRPLLDDADRIHDDVWPRPRDRVGDRVELKGIDAGDRLGPAVERREIGDGRAEGRERHRLRGEQLAKLVAEHARATEDQDAPIAGPLGAYGRFT